jgi:hypothetical protein
MNWEALGAVGEAMGGTGVVLTLLYLAIQVRQHTAEMRAQASESVAENLREWLRPMIEDPELSRIFRTGAEGWDHFPPDDKARFFHMTFVWLKTIEAAHYQFSRGRLDPEVWRGSEAVVTSYLRGPGIRAYWSLRRDGFSAAFRAYVDSVPLDGPHFPRVGEVTGEAELPVTREAGAAQPTGAAPVLEGASLGPDGREFFPGDVLLNGGVGLAARDPAVGVLGHPHRPPSGRHEDHHTQDHPDHRNQGQEEDLRDRDLLLSLFPVEPPHDPGCRQETHHGGEDQAEEGFRDNIPIRQVAEEAQGPHAQDEGDHHDLGDPALEEGVQDLRRACEDASLGSGGIRAPGQGLRHEGGAGPLRGLLGEAAFQDAGEVGVNVGAKGGQGNGVGVEVR